MKQRRLPHRDQTRDTTSSRLQEPKPACPCDKAREEKLLQVPSAYKSGDHSPAGHEPESWPQIWEKDRPEFGSQLCCAGFVMAGKPISSPVDHGRGSVRALQGFSSAQGKAAQEEARARASEPET